LQRDGHDLHKGGAMILTTAWREQLRGQVREARSLGHLSPGTDVDQFVWELFGIYLSHHVSSRFIRDDAADARARTALDALIRRHQPSPARTVS
jgi:hypothetical protein